MLERIGGKLYTKNSPELEGVNQAYLSGHLTEAQALRRLKELALAWEMGSHSNIAQSLNEQFVESFWKNSPKGEIKHRRNPHAQSTAKSGYYAVARLLPRVDLATATMSEVLSGLKSIESWDRRWKVAARINTMWLWHGRRPADCIAIPKVRHTRRKTAYLTIEQVTQAAAKLQYPLNLYCLAGFATGCRPGELYALTPEDMRHNNTHVWIDKAWSLSGEVVATKNDQVGMAFVVPEFRDALKKWLEVPVEVKKYWRRKSKHAEHFQREFSGEDAYILRHSYARYMLGLGATLQDLRMWMRTNVVTIEAYYLHWVQTSAEMDGNLKRFG